MAGKGRKSVNKSEGDEQVLFNKMKDELKDIIRDMFKAHEKNIIDILAANHNMMNERINKLTDKIEELQNSLQFTETEMNEKLLKIENETKKETNELKEKIRDLEDRTRRNNLRIDGVKESEKETWEDTEKKVNEIFKHKLGITTHVKIERAHRTGKTKSDRQKERTIVLKVLDYKDKVTILKNARKLKGTGIFINEDYSRETMELRKKLWSGVLRLRQEGKFAVLQYDRIVQHDFRK